jgi:SAM-dependent methyltransferase
MSHKDLLDEINQDLPKGVDWKAGARRYVKAAFESSDEAVITRYALTKPMYALGKGPGSERGLEEAVRYLNNFVNMIGLLKLPGGSRFMDVASGPGWVSHYLRRFGYETFGFDISEDFVELAKRRIRDDASLGIPESDAAAMFAVHDIEDAPLSAEHDGQYDAILLESCLHHFYNPMAALTHLVRCLKPDGVVVLIEGENRTGPIREEWMSVMREYDTIERPYPREQLIRILEASGLPHSEFMGQINGLISPRDPIWGDATARLREAERHMNLAVCAKTEAALDRIFPFRAELPKE